MATSPSTTTLLLLLLLLLTAGRTAPLCAVQMCSRLTTSSSPMTVLVLVLVANTTLRTAAAVSTHPSVVMVTMVPVLAAAMIRVGRSLHGGSGGGVRGSCRRCVVSVTVPVVAVAPTMRPHTTSAPTTASVSLALPRTPVSSTHTHTAAATSTWASRSWRFDVPPAIRTATG